MQPQKPELNHYGQRRLSARRSRPSLPQNNPIGVQRQRRRKPMRASHEMTIIRAMERRRRGNLKVIWILLSVVIGAVLLVWLLRGANIVKSGIEATQQHDEAHDEAQDIRDAEADEQYRQRIIKEHDEFVFRQYSIKTPAQTVQLNTEVRFWKLENPDWQMILLAEDYK